MTSEDFKKYIKDVIDFPKKGIVFKDISPLLRNPKAYKKAIELMSKNLQAVDAIISPAARGFLFGPQIAIEKNIPFIMVRKQGKLPGNKIKIDYELEYGKNTMEMIDGLIKHGDKIAVIDDVLATGGTTNALIELVEKQGGFVTQAVFLVELTFLYGKNAINLANDKIKSLIML